jgi:hypothetical protein
MQVLKELWTESETPKIRNTYHYVFDLRNRLEETCRIERESLRESLKRYTHYNDKGKRTLKFKAGDKVLLLLPTDTIKLLLQWKWPFEVVEVINETWKLKMLDAGVIEPSSSPYTAPVVRVKKKDGTNRFFTNFRFLNMVTRFDLEPMGNPENILTRLGDD